MRAVGYTEPGSIDRENALVDVDMAVPDMPQGHDMLVEVKAVSVNPVDVKLRRGSAVTGGAPRVLGFDAAGIVRTVGPSVASFRPGDAVMYAGSITRSGSNAELQLVDERIVGRKPIRLDWAEAAALPLTAITAWEVLFDRLDVRRPVAGGAHALLVIGGAGGVGSIAVQLARSLTDLTVIATASRAETKAWATAMGAHHVIDHARPLAAQVAALGVGAPAFVFATTHTDQHASEIVELIAPQGRFSLIDDPQTLNVMPFKRKSVSVHHELMFTRSIYGTPDIGEQHRLLQDVADLVDAGTLRTTLTRRLSPINAANLSLAHRAVEAGSMRGKLALEGWA